MTLLCPKFSPRVTCGHVERLWGFLGCGLKDGEPCAGGLAGGHPLVFGGWQDVAIYG